MRAPSRLFPALFVLLSLVFVGCGTVTYVVQKYGGDPRPADTIAILRIDNDDRLHVSAVDGEPLDVRLTPDTRVHVELLPGGHILDVYKPDVDLPVAQHIRFIAKAGQAYHVELAAAPPGSPTTWAGRIFEIDKSSGAPVRDVTR